MTSTYWAANQPDQQNIVADPGYTCVMMNMPSGRWSNSYTEPTQNICEQALPRVCKINLDNWAPAKNSDERGQRVDCPMGWTSVDGEGCLRAFSDAVTWYEAEARCNTLYKQYGHLASIHGNNKNSLTVSLYTTSVGSEGRFWIGGQRNSANGFEWTDYSDFTFTKWEVGQPSATVGETAENCVSVYSNGKWNDDSCEGQKLGYVCQAPQQYENCQYINDNDKKECGIGIISERLCDELQCCFDPSAIIQCYKPGTSSMTPGKAAGITAGVFICLGAVLIGYMKFSGS